MTSVRKAVFLSLLQRYAAFAVQLATSIILARLLRPAEIGIFSLAAAVAGIAQMLRDFGIGEYIVQERQLSRERLRSALGLTFIMSWAIAALLLAVADFVATFYGEPGVAKVIHVLALNFVLIPLGSTTFAVLTKELAYGTIFRVQTLSAVVGAVACVVLALNEYSYMSMAWSSLASILTTVLMLAVMRPAETLMLPRFSGLRAAARFGGTLTIGRLADQVSRKAPDFFVGAHLGFSAVGINSKASSLLDAFQDFFASGVTRVAGPAFARGERDPAQTRADFLRGSRIVLVFPFLFYGFCGLFADPIIRLLFGDQWLEAIPLIYVASVSSLLFSPYLLASPALTAYGRVTELLRVQLVGALLYVPAIFFASKISLVVMAVAAALASIPRFYILQRALATTFDLRARDLFGSSVQSFAVAAIGVGCAAPSLMFYAHTTLSAFGVIVSATLSLALGTLAGLYLLDHPLAAEISDRLRYTVRRRRKGGQP